MHPCFEYLQCCKNCPQPNTVRQLLSFRSNTEINLSLGSASSSHGVRDREVARCAAPWQSWRGHGQGYLGFLPQAGLVPISSSGPGTAICQVPLLLPGLVIRSLFQWFTKGINLHRAIRLPDLYLLTAESLLINSICLAFKNHSFIKGM